MQFKIPHGESSPTVIVIGGGTMDKHKNDMHAKRMDNLERKLDQQYERLSKRQPIIKQPDFNPLLKSFGSRVGSLEKAIRRLADKDTDNGNDELLATFKKLISRIEKNKPQSSPVDYKQFMSKLSRLEEVIKDLPKQKISVNTNGLSNSFNKLYERLEKAIKDARPRMIPSPS